MSTVVPVFVPETEIQNRATRRMSVSTINEDQVGDMYIFN